MTARQQKWTRAALIALAAVGVIGLLAATLGVVTHGSSSQPSECTGSANASESEDCKEALLNKGLDAGAPAALDDVDQATRIRVARALCRQGDDAATATPRPLRSTVYAAVAKAQDISVDAVAAVAGELDQLCSGQAETVLGLPQSHGAFSVQLQVDGTGPITVRYTNSDGKNVKDEGFAPWSMPITLSASSDVTLEASSRTIDDPDAKPADDLRCSVVVGSTTVANDGPSTKGGSVKCTASSEDLMTAASTPASSGG